MLNFFNFYFRCYEMEKRLKTPDLFKFPFFEAICWFVAKNLLETLKGNNLNILLFHVMHDIYKFT